MKNAAQKKNSRSSEAPDRMKGPRKIIFAAAAAALVLILALLLHGNTETSRYNRYRKQAAESYQAGDYDQALSDLLAADEVGVFCETAHPAKFKEKVDDILGIDVAIPARLAAFMQGQKQSVPLSSDYAELRAYLMSK